MTSIIHDNLFPISGSNGGCPGERLLVVCDFDGTVCRVDMGNAFLERFAEGWEEIDHSYSAGEVGSRVAYSRIAPLFRANRSQVLDFVLRRERLDPLFPEFLSFCRGRKIDLKIVSDGLDVLHRGDPSKTRSRCRILLQPTRLSGEWPDRLRLSLGERGVRPLRNLQAFPHRPFPAGL